MSKRPNILVVMSDEHSRSFTEPYGHPFVKTPHMQRLADEGTTFVNAYCNSPICNPSRASFMTGQHTPKVGAWDNAATLSSDEATWAHLINAAGYETVLCGKMHFQGADQMHGFQRRILSDVHGNANPRLTADWVGWHPENAAADYSMFTQAGPGEHAYSAYDEVAAAQASTYIRAQESADRPWALLVGLITPHFPFIARQKYWDMYYPEHADQPRIPAHMDDIHPHKRRLAEWFSYVDVDPELVARARAAYYGLITYCDDCLGQILAAVDESGQGDDTVIVYTSDHGDAVGEHGMWTKQTFYEDSVGVPLHVRWPGKVDAGRRVNQPVSLIDVTQTLLDSAAVEAPGYWSGESLLGLAGGEPEGPGEVIADYTAVAAKGPCRMVRVGDLKYNYYHGEPEELFDLAADPDELVNQIENPAYADALDDLRARARRDYDPDEVYDRALRSQQNRRLVNAGRASTPTGSWVPGRP